MNIEKFLNERDEALLSLDKEKILKYMRKYQGNYSPSSETVFWASVHKCILAISSATQEQKERSKQWLIEHGFRPGF